MSSSDLPDQTLRVLLSTFAIQAAVTMSNSVLPTIAPKLAESLQLDPALIGYQVSILFAGAVTGTLFGGGFTRRYGACRTMQISTGIAVAGLLLILLPSIAAIIVGSLIAGFGQGTLNSATAHLLVKYTKSARRNLIFSVKQSGVPFGGMLVALTAPIIALTFGWRWAVVSIALMLIVLAVAIQANRDEWDADREPNAEAGEQRFGGIPLVMGDTALRWLAISGLLFAAMQRCLLTFAVVYLVTERGYSLIDAGFLLSMMHVGGVLGRLFWGWIADRSGSRRVLIVIAIACVANTFALMAIASVWPLWLVYALFFFFGATALGWNGVLHAETARLAPSGLTGVVAGGSTFFVFAGVLVGPSLFAAAYSLIGEYSTTFVLVAIMSAAGGALVSRARRDTSDAPVHA